MQNNRKNFLKEIIAIKQEDIKRMQDKKQLIKSKEGFAFRELFNKAKMGLIAEVKFASPTNPSLGSVDELLERVKAYEEARADAISIITENHFFKGDSAFVTKVKKTVKLPVLQKDFVIDEKQIYQAKEIGSDALLLIARLVDKETLKNFVNLCFSLGIEPVVEINSKEDLEKAVKTKTNIIAVNARDLETFVVDIANACELMKKIPDKFIKLGFSGIYSAKEVAMYKRAGAKGVLVGTSLMKAKNVNRLIKNLQVLPDKASVQVKICATRSLKAAQIAAESGAEFLGMVFTPHTKTHTVSMQVAKKIGKIMKGKIQLVGVFQNMPLEEVQQIITECNLDFAQFHGDEQPEYIDQIKVKVIKAFRFPGDVNLSQARKQMKKYQVNYYLVDRIKQSEGPMLDFEKVKALAKEFPLVFAGGLNPENVAEVIQVVKPVMVDVASGVEIDGKQDLQKIRSFVKNAKGVTV